MLTANAFANPFVRFDYNLFSTSDPKARSTVFIELFDDRPITRDNFLTYVNNGVYDQTLMHRLVRNFVLQGGGFEGSGVFFGGPPFPYIFPIETDQDGNPNTENPMIVNEFNNSPPRSNLAGTLAMAKLSPPSEGGPPNGGPNSASSEFFFNIVNNNTGGLCGSGLDCQNGGFTVFAQVVGDGMNLINGYNIGLSIQNLNPDSNGNGAREAGDGPFSSVPTAGSTATNYTALVLTNADQIDYLGAGSTTTIPSGGLTFSARDVFIDTNAMFTGTGELVVGAGRTLGVREGSVLASRSMRNLGTLEPGLQIGAISLQSFRQDAGANLEIQLRGSTAYDSVNVSGAALLGGELDVSLLSFNPAPGQNFTVLTASLISDNFDQINLPQLLAGYVWNITRTNTSLTLSVSAGDYNRDGVVDAGDYIIWRKMRNTSVTNAYDGADGNGDKAINDLDYSIWRKNLGNTRGGEGGAGGIANIPVPEPAAALLLLMAMPFAVFRRGRKMA